MNTLQKIEVMQAYLDGKPIEYKHITETEWAPARSWGPPGWDWVNYNYRVAPIKQKYRVALVKGFGNIFYPTAVSEKYWKEHENVPHFGRWISDVMEYELTDTTKTAC